MRPTTQIMSLVQFVKHPDKDEWMQKFENEKKWKKKQWKKSVTRIYLKPDFLFEPENPKIWIWTRNIFGYRGRFILCYFIIFYQLRTELQSAAWLNKSTKHSWNHGNASIHIHDCIQSSCTTCSAWQGLEHFGVMLKNFRDMKISPNQYPKSKFQRSENKKRQNGSKKEKNAKHWCAQCDH